MAIEREVTLTWMASVKKPKTKRVSTAILEHVSEVVRKLVEERFEGNQTSAAKALDCSQSQVSAMISKTRGPGLNTLLALRELTDRSIDSLLGLPMLPSEELLQALRQTLDTHMATELIVKRAALDAYDMKAKPLEPKPPHKHKKGEKHEE